MGEENRQRSDGDHTTHVMAHFKSYLLTDDTAVCGSTSAGEAGVVQAFSRQMAVLRVSPLEIIATKCEELKNGWRYMDLPFWRSGNSRWSFSSGFLPAAREFGYELEPPKDFMSNSYDNDGDRDRKSCTRGIAYLRDDFLKI